MRRIEYIGLLLVGLSAYPLLLMTREMLAHRSAYSRYKLIWVPTDEPGFAADALSIQVGPHSIKLRDGLENQTWKPEDRARTRIDILVDGNDYSCDGEVEVRPFYRDQTPLLGRDDSTCRQASWHRTGRGGAANFASAGVWACGLGLSKEAIAIPHSAHRSGWSRLRGDFLLPGPRPSSVPDHARQIRHALRYRLPLPSVSSVA